MSVGNIRTPNAMRAADDGLTLQSELQGPTGAYTYEAMVKLDALDTTGVIMALRDGAVGSLGQPPRDR